MFDALKNTRAIVFDNRGYPRGAAWTVAPRLTTATGARAALFDTPLVTDPLDVQLGDIQSVANRSEVLSTAPNFGPLEISKADGDAHRRARHQPVRT